MFTASEVLITQSQFIIYNLDIALILKVFFNCHIMLAVADFDISEGIKFYEEGNFEKALSFFLNFRDPDTPEEASELAYYLGLLAIKRADYELAVNSLEQVVTTSMDAKKINQCRLLLSLAYAQTGRLKLAEAELSILQNTESENSTELFNALAFLAFERKDTEKAQEYYEQVLAEDPENSTAMNGLGYILADSEKDIPRALILCRQACDAKANYAPYLDSLAWVYHKMKLHNEAKKLIEKAKLLLPENAIIQKHYNEIFNF